MGQANKLEHQIKMIDAFKGNDTIALKEFYISNYKKIEVLILKNSGNLSDAKHIYQEAFITVWNNIRNDAFTPANNSTLSDYLYTIAKNKWMDTVRSNQYKKTKVLKSEHTLSIKNEGDKTVIELEDKKISKAMEAFKNLGQPCKQLLTTFYFDKKLLQDIATELILDETSVRNKKFHCMKKLVDNVFSIKKP
ncbi:RNA polymerase sigma factor (sigma-70 family) [Mariniflexile fucanivorans]|uniref:RNA polymerase sigma factor (Sigma-70 family) n=1 Tax=Mariniflexile fucanivorans TaxID=264023 RepID=A0A4R1RLH2_9FLAO|nr:sigma-70 family RNA polymerase sigma factor [Mariniflexile fucanivorans]TCL67071.1 RNA polymerase sigma factor (sigma-70 family) [Mariniflexile fucanivorans]